MDLARPEFGLGARRVRGRNLGRTAALLVAGSAAVWGGPAAASCAASIQPAYLADFTSDPRALLRANPRGGPSVSGQIRTLAVNGIASLRAIGTIVPQANAQQKEAIGIGLAQASGACAPRSPEIARRITDLVRASGDRDLSRAYARFFSTPDDRASGGTTTTGSNSDLGQGRKSIGLDDSRGRLPLPLGNPFAKP